MFTVLLCLLSHDVGPLEGSVNLHVHFTPAQYIPVFMHLSQMHQRIPVASRLPQKRRYICQCVSTLTRLGWSGSWGMPSNVTGTAALDHVVHLWWNGVTKLVGNQQRAGCAGTSSRNPTVRIRTTCRALVRPTSRNSLPTCAISFLCWDKNSFRGVSSGLGLAREQAGAIGSSAEVSAPLSCPLSSLTHFSKSSGGSCGRIHVMRNS